MEPRTFTLIHQGAEWRQKAARKTNQYFLYLCKCKRIVLQKLQPLFWIHICRSNNLKLHHFPFSQLSLTVAVYTAYTEKCLHLHFTRHTACWWTASPNIQPRGAEVSPTTINTEFLLPQQMYRRSLNRGYSCSQKELPEVAEQLLDTKHSY